MSDWANFSDKKVLIINSCVALSERLKASLSKAGFHSDQVSISIPSHAETALKNSQPALVVGSAVEDIAHAPASAIRGVVSTDGSQLALSKAAEKAVDFYVLSPGSLPRFVEYIERAVQRRLNPGPYLRSVQEAVEPLKTSNDPAVLNHALEQLEAAKTLDPKPTYALAQSALVFEKLEHFPEAENRCQTGLLYYPAHFQSHQILSRVLIRMQRMDEAYQAFRNFVSIYPASGLRLDSILRFAIARKSFDDVDSLFASLSKEAFLTPDAERALSAAMVTCGKHFFSTGDQKRALSYFKNAVRSSRYSPKHIGEIEKFLAPLGRADLMTELLKKPSGREARK